MKNTAFVPTGPVLAGVSNQDHDCWDYMSWAGPDDNNTSRDLPPDRGSLCIHPLPQEVPPVIINLSDNDEKIENENEFNRDSRPTATPDSSTHLEVPKPTDDESVNLSIPAFNIQCKQFLTDLANHEDQIKQLLYSLSHDITFFLSTIVDVPPLTDVYVIRNAFAPIAVALDTYQQAVCGRKELEQSHVDWLNRLCTSTSHILPTDTHRAIMAWKMKLETGEPNRYREQEARGVAWAPILARRNGCELLPFMRSIERIVGKWARVRSGELFQLEGDVRAVIGFGLSDLVTEVGDAFRLSGVTTSVGPEDELGAKRSQS